MTSKAQFRQQTFHELNLIHWIKYLKSSAPQSIRNACFNLEQLSCSFYLAKLGISSLERLCNSFNSDAEIFMYRTLCINYYNLFCKQFDQNEHFLRVELTSAAIMIGVWINSACLNNHFRLVSIVIRFGLWKVCWLTWA